MSTSAPAVAPQRAAWTPARIGLALAIAIGTATGAIATTMIVQQATSGGATAEDAQATQVYLSSLVSKADAAARRGDVRLAVQFRNDLAAYVASEEIADQLTHLATKADVAARRGDVRLALQFRNELAAAIAAVNEDLREGE